MANEKAKINYYAKLVQRGYYKEENVPEELREAVLNKVEELPPLEHDPETEIPEEK